MIGFALQVLQVWTSGFDRTLWSLEFFLCITKDPGVQKSEYQLPVLDNLPIALCKQYGKNLVQETSILKLCVGRDCVDHVLFLFYKHKMHLYVCSLFTKWYFQLRETHRQHFGPLFSDGTCLVFLLCLEFIFWGTNKRWILWIDWSGLYLTRIQQICV